MSLVIHFVRPEDPAARHPWPVAVDGNNRVQSGLGSDDGATLMGFEKPGSHSLEVMVADAIEKPELVLGLHPIFGGSGGMFSWALEVQQLEVKP